MKKKLFLTMLGSISMLLGIVGCKKSVDNQGSGQSESGSQESSVDELSTIDKYQELLGKDIKLEGNVVLTQTIKGGAKDGSDQVENMDLFMTLTAFSESRYNYDFYDINGEQEYSNYYEENKSDDDKNGYLKYDYIDKTNTVQTRVGSKKFSQIFKNPFSSYIDEYKEVDDKTFTFDDAKFDANTFFDSLFPDISYSRVLSVYKNYGALEFKTANIKEVKENELQIEFLSDKFSFQAATGAQVESVTSAKLDITLNNGDAFKDEDRLSPYDKTTESDALQTKFKAISDAQKYKIERTSQKLDMTTGEGTGEVTSYSVYYDNGKVYNELSKSGQDVKENKHYRYSYNEDYRMFIADTSIEDLNSITDYAQLKESNEPDPNQISACLFDAEKDKNGVTQYSAKEELEQTGVLNDLIFALAEDRASKLKAIGYEIQSDGTNKYTGGSWIKNLTLTLDATSNLSMQYWLVVPEGNNYNVTIEQYKFVLDNTFTYPTFIEKAPSKIIGEWELVGSKEDSETDLYIKEGITLDISWDDTNNTAGVTLKQGETNISVSNIEVKDGVVSFKVGEESATAIKSDSGVTLTLGDKTYSLVVSRGAIGKAKDAATAIVNTIDPNSFSTEVLYDESQTDPKNDQAYVTDLKTKALADINSATSKEDVEKIQQEFVETINAIKLLEAKVAALTAVRAEISLYPSDNGITYQQCMAELQAGTKHSISDMNDQGQIEYYLNYYGKLEAISSATTVDEVEQAKNNALTIIANLARNNNYIKTSERAAYISQQQAAITAINFDQYDKLSDNTKSALVALKNAVLDTTDKSEAQQKKDIDAFLDKYNSVFCVPDAFQKSWTFTKQIDDTTSESITIDLYVYYLTFKTASSSEDVADISFGYYSKGGYYYFDFYLANGDHYQAQITIGSNGASGALGKFDTDGNATDIWQLSSVAAFPSDQGN